MHHLSRDELGDGELDDVRGAVDVGDGTSALVRPPGSVPSPSTISLLSIVSTSKWMATRVQPVAATHSIKGWVVCRSSSGLNDWMPHSVTFGKSSSLHEWSPTNATRSGETVAGSNSDTSGHRAQ